MVKVRQFGGGVYDTKDYPYILLSPRTNRVYGRFSTLERAHRGRLQHVLYHQHDDAGDVLLYNEKTKKLIDWRKKERIEFEKNKHKYDF